MHASLAKLELGLKPAQQRFRPGELGGVGYFLRDINFFPGLKVRGHESSTKITREAMNQGGSTHVV